VKSATRSRDCWPTAAIIFPACITMPIICPKAPACVLWER
jgi:hypothetical protein